MDIQRLLNDFPEVNITLSAKDLLIFAECIATQIAEKILANKTEKVFTRDEVIQKFKISNSTLYRWTKYGLIKSTTIGQRVYYSESEIEKLIRR